jgi:hypothetical protein
MVSPARRAQQTASALERKFKTVAALAPGGTVPGLLAATRWPDAKEPVLVVGHQPTLGLVAAYLLAGVAQPWAVKKGALWWLRRRDRAGDDQTVLVTVRGPERLIGSGECGAQCIQRRQGHSCIRKCPAGTLCTAAFKAPATACAPLGNVIWSNAPSTK